MPLPTVLFGEKEGKIARANRGRDPLFLFAASQRQLAYPKVPYRKPMHDPLAQLPTILAKQREFEQRLNVARALYAGGVRRRRKAMASSSESCSVEPGLAS